MRYRRIEYVALAMAFALVLVLTAGCASTAPRKPKANPVVSALLIKECKDIRMILLVHADGREIDFSLPDSSNFDRRLANIKMMQEHNGPVGEISLRDNCDRI